MSLALWYSLERRLAGEFLGEQNGWGEDDTIRQLRLVLLLGHEALLWRVHVHEFQILLR